jgi:hypothetical protein
MLRIICFSFWFLFHPVHVTITSIDFVPEMNVFKVFVRMYFDDFLRDCKLEAGDVQNKNFTSNNSSSREVMENYLKEKIMLKLNTEQLSGKLTDMSLADNEISMNLEFWARKKPKTFTVKNLIMTNLYSDQSNMVIVKINEFEEGVKLTTDITEQTFKIK